MPTAAPRPRAPTRITPLLPAASVLRAVLPDKGYTAHVLGFTAAALLEALVAAGAQPGQLDACLELLLPTLEGDLFGEVGRLACIGRVASRVYCMCIRCTAC